MFTAETVPSIKPAVALGAFFKLAQTWSLTREESSLLLGVSEKTLKRYEDTPDRNTLDRNTLERISLLVNIWADLRSLFRSNEDALRWLRTENAFFGETAPLERMFAGNVTDIEAVRRSIAYAIAA